MKLRHLNANYFTFAVLRTKTNTPSFVRFPSIRLKFQQRRKALSVRKKINKFAFRRVNIIFFSLPLQVYNKTFQRCLERNRNHSTSFSYTIANNYKTYMDDYHSEKCKRNVEG